jgi:hypothetical protein
MMLSLRLGLSGHLATLALLGGCFWMHAPQQTAGTDKQPLAAKAPALVNPEAEKLAWDAAQKWAPSVGTPAPTILRAFVTGNDWLIERNPNTGIPIRRTLQAYVMYKGGESGKCRDAINLLVEDNQGGSNWGQPRIEGTNTVIAVTCDSVDAMRPSPPQ